MLGDGDPFLLSFGNSTEPRTRFLRGFQILMACVFLGFGKVAASRIASWHLVERGAEWTAVERVAVEGHRELNHWRGRRPR
jgi:hypothetical protein